MKCPRCASEVLNTKVCSNCGLVFENSERKSGFKKLLIGIFIAVIIFLSILVFAGVFKEKEQKYGFVTPKVEGVLEKYENGYVIYINSVSKKPTITDLKYQLVDKDGKVVFTQHIVEIYGIDFKFGDYNASSEPFRVKFHDTHDNDIDGIDGKVSKGDYFVLRKNSNNSEIKFFKLIFTPTGEDCLTIELKDDIPFTKINVKEHDINNKWTITNSSANSTIEIDTNKTALSSYQAISGQEIEILLTIYNKNNLSANLTLNVSDYYDRTNYLITSSNMINITKPNYQTGFMGIQINGNHPIPQNESVIVKVSYRLPDAFTHNISIKIFDKNSNSTLNASVSLFVAVRSG